MVTQCSQHRTPMVKDMDQARTHGKTCASCRVCYGDSNAPSDRAQNPRSRAWSRSAANTEHPWSRSWTKTVCMANPTHLVEYVTVIPTHHQGTLRTHGVRRGHAVQPRHPWSGSRTTKPVCMAKPAHLVEFVMVIPTHHQTVLRTHGVGHGHAVQPAQDTHGQGHGPSPYAWQNLRIL